MQEKLKAESDPIKREKIKNNRLAHNSQLRALQFNPDAFRKNKKLKLKNIETKEQKRRWLLQSKKPLQHLLLQELFHHLLLQNCQNLKSHQQLIFLNHMIYRTQILFVITMLAMNIYVNYRINNKDFVAIGMVCLV